MYFIISTPYSNLTPSKTPTNSSQLRNLIYFFL